MPNQFSGMDHVSHQPNEDPKPEPREARIHEVSPDGSGYRIRYDDTGEVNHIDKYIPEEELALIAKAEDAETEEESENDEAESPEDLNSLTIAELKALPEWEGVEHKSEITHHADIVKAIKKARRKRQ